MVFLCALDLHFKICIFFVSLKVITKITAVCTVSRIVNSSTACLCGVGGLVCVWGGLRAVV